MYQKIVIICTLLIVLLNLSAQAQEPEAPFYFGVDLSYVNEMEDCGAVYHVDGVPTDVFEIFATHGTDVVRARLWHTPTWTDYSTLEDVQRTFRRAQDHGMQTMLDFHYSDTWTDPGHQAIPAAWQHHANDTEALVQDLYDYTQDVLFTLHAEGLTPDFVQIGNEINNGLVKEGSVLDWSHDAPLINAGIAAVRDFAVSNNIAAPLIVLQVAQPDYGEWWVSEATAAGVTDFDIIGLSYYLLWTEYTISDVGVTIANLRQRFNKDVIIVETGHPWTNDYADDANNILDAEPHGYPLTPRGQQDFMTALTQEVMSNGGIGVFYWEPAWVSTDCFTLWGHGSHWENATFFDFDHNLHSGIDYMTADYSLTNDN